MGGVGNLDVGVVVGGCEHDLQGFKEARSVCEQIWAQRLRALPLFPRPSSQIYLNGLEGSRLQDI